MFVKRVLWTLLSLQLLLGQQDFASATPEDEAMLINEEVDYESDSHRFLELWTPNCTKAKHRWRPQCQCKYPPNWDKPICQGENWWGREDIKSNVEKLGKIVGGENAPVDAYPWFSRSVVRGGDWAGCGGSLVAPQYVLTAAHCVAPNTWWSADLAAVQIGAVCVAAGSNNCDQPIQEINVESITPHPNYNPSTLDNDFALLKLVTAASATPVAMDQGQYANNYSSSKRKLYPIGFGDLQAGSATYPDRLRHVEVQFVPRDTCNVNYNGGITDNMMCGADPGKDSCQGDSGGPFYDQENNVLVGVVSWGYGCADPSFPGVYAQISSQWTWIKSTICGGSNPQPSFCGNTPTPPTPTPPTPTPPTPTPPTPTGCPTGQLDVDVSVTTDSYPAEISWTITEKGSTNVIQQSPSYNTADTEYAPPDICLDSSKCYTFTMNDSYGDGLLGNGDFKLTVDGTVELSDPNESYFTLTKDFGQCDGVVTNPPVTSPPVTDPPVTAPPVTDAPVTSPPVVAPTPPTPTECPTGQLDVDVSVTTDNYPAEISWTITEKGSAFVIEQSPTYTNVETEYAPPYICLDPSKCYTFTMNDSYGDGLLGNGDFKLTVDGTVELSDPNEGYFSLTKDFGQCGVVTNPPVTSPPVTDAPVTSPPVTSAPVTSPPVTSAPVTSPPVTLAPITSPPVIAPTSTNCGNDNLSVEISVTTDDYPTELSWSIGNIVNDPFTEKRTTYVKNLCLPSTSCHNFILSDSFGDGILTNQGGAMSVKVNGSTLLTLGNGFTNELSVKFGSCSEDGPCPNNRLKRFKLVLTTDGFGAETSFKVMQRKPNGKFKKRVFGKDANFFSSNTTYRLSKCLKKNKCYRLILQDSHGDGICCSHGEGSFQGYWKGNPIPTYKDKFDDGDSISTYPFGNCDS